MGRKIQVGGLLATRRLGSNVCVCLCVESYIGKTILYSIEHLYYERTIFCGGVCVCVTGLMRSYTKYEIIIINEMLVLFSGIYAYNIFIL